MYEAYAGLALVKVATKIAALLSINHFHIGEQLHWNDENEKDPKLLEWRTHLHRKTWSEMSALKLCLVREL